MHIAEHCAPHLDRISSHNHSRIGSFISGTFSLQQKLRMLCCGDAKRDTNAETRLWVSDRSHHAGVAALLADHLGAPSQCLLHKY